MLALAIAYTVALVLAIVALYTLDAPQNCGTWHDTARGAEIVADLMLDAVAPAHRRTVDAPSPELTYPAAIQIPALLEIARRTARTPRPSAPVAAPVYDTVQAVHADTGEIVASFEIPQHWFARLVDNALEIVHGGTVYATIDTCALIWVDGEARRYVRVPRYVHDLTLDRGQRHLPMDGTSWPSINYFARTAAAC